MSVVLKRLLKKALVLFVMNLLFLGAVAGSARGGQSKQWQLSTDAIDHIGKSSENNIDLTDMLIELSVKAEADLMDSDLSFKKEKQKFDSFLSNIESQIDRKQTIKEIINQINGILFQKNNFRVNRQRIFESSLEDILLTRLRRRKKGNCLSLSLLMLIIAEDFQMPLKGAIVPGHFFIRYQQKGSYRNIEMTSQGRELPDEYYRKNFTQGQPEDFSIRILKKKEILAVFISSLATHYKLKGYHEHAICLYQAVLKIINDFPDIYINLGNAFERDGQIKRAVFEYQKALSLNPYLCEIHHNLGLIHFVYTGNIKEALRHGKIARILGCQLYPQYNNFVEHFENLFR